MVVYLLNKEGKALMPTTPRKARLLLKKGKAKVIRIKPFTIQLLFGSGGYKQDIMSFISTRRYDGILECS